MMALAVYSVLVLDKKAVGVRFNDDKNFFDVEMEKLTGVRKDNLSGVKTQTLKANGNLLVTDEELKTNLLVEDKSNDSTFCELALKLLTTRNAQPETTNKPVQRKGNLKSFKVVVEVEVYNPMTNKKEFKTLNGEFESVNALKARSEAKAFYANEFGTEKEEIKVVSAELVK